MTDLKKPGRPRLYEDTSSKMGAFRSRLAQSGWLRKEVLMSADTAEQIRRVSEAAGVPFQDAASGLLEFGLAQHLALLPGCKGGASACATTVALAAPSAHLAEGAPGDNDPVTRFFQKRKESRHA